MKPKELGVLHLSFNWELLKLMHAGTFPFKSTFHFESEFIFSSSSSEKWLNASVFTFGWAGIRHHRSFSFVFAFINSDHIEMLVGLTKSRTSSFNYWFSKMGGALKSSGLGEAQHPRAATFARWRLHSRGGKSTELTGLLSHVSQLVVKKSIQ